MQRTRLLAAAGLFLAASLRILADTTFAYSLSGAQATITGFTATASASGSLTIPAAVDGYTVVGIARGAFKNQSAITSLAFTGSTVTNIGPQAFQGCTGLVSATLPSGVATVPAGLFLGCTSLASATLPASATSIEAAAFADCTTLASVALPASLTTLGEGAFQNCSALAAVSIPAGLAAVPSHGFDGCRSLASVSLASGVARIGAHAFANADALVSVTLPASVVGVGAGAFRDCDALASLALGAGVTSLDDGFAYGCPSLAAFSVATGNTAYSATGGVLFDADSSTLLLAPPALTGIYSVPSTVADLAADCFARCRLLTGVNLPPALTAIPDGAFYYAEGLASITFPTTVTTIGAWAFGGCSNLETVVLPAALASLADDAFHYATSLTSAIFAGNAPTMGATVFDNTAAGFTLYYRAAASGYTATTWSGYASAAFAVPLKVASWLAAHGNAASADVTADPDGDGVPLLLAYAFGLDPAADLSASLPAPELVDGYLAIAYPASAEGIIYTPQSSADLAAWIADGVSIVGPDSEGTSVAMIPLSSDRAFLRLRVEIAE